MFLNYLYGCVEHTLWMFFLTTCNAMKQSFNKQVPSPCIVGAREDADAHDAAHIPPTAFHAVPLLDSCRQQCAKKCGHKGKEGEDC